MPSNVVADDIYNYPVKVEDSGPATKKVTIEIPQERINAKIAEESKTFRSQAALPGFRPGKVPQKLIEKRFANDIRDQVRRSLISESYAQAMEANSIEVLGEPEFDDVAAIQKLPEVGGMTVAFTVETQPHFEMPNFGDCTVKKPKVEVTDANVDQAMQNLREQQGTMIPVDGRGVKEKDYLLADVHVKLDGNAIAHQHGANLVARAGRIGGIQIDDLAEKVSGMKIGETRTFDAAVPDDHPNETIKGKTVQIEVKLNDLRQLELAELTPEFLESLGFVNEAELREALREQLIERIDFDIAQTLRAQVADFLIKNVNIELPAKMSARQSERVVQRRAMDLLSRGVPRDTIQQHADQIRAGADTEAARELKLFFILQKVVADEKIEVDEGELNNRIATIAALRGERPEKLRQHMAKDGSLVNLFNQMREWKALDALLPRCKLEDVEVPQPAEKKD